MKYYGILYITVILVLIVGILFQPENYILVQEFQDYFVRCFIVAGLIFSIPVLPIMFSNIRVHNKSALKAVKDSLFALLAVSVLTTIFFGFSAPAFCAHYIALTPTSDFSAEGTFQIHDSSGVVVGKSRRGALIVAAILAVRGASDEIISFNDVARKQNYQLHIETKLATHKLTYPANIIKISNNFPKPAVIKGVRSDYGSVIYSIDYL